MVEVAQAEPHAWASASSSHAKQVKETGPVNFASRFYLIQDIQNIIVDISNQHKNY